MKYKNKFLNAFLAFCLILNLFSPLVVLAEENIEDTGTTTEETLVVDTPVQDEVQDESGDVDDTDQVEKIDEGTQTDEEKNSADTASTEEITESSETVMSSFESETLTAPETKTVHLHIRNGGDIVFEDDVIVTVGENIDVADNTDTTHSVPSDSVLAVLNGADTASDNFNVSDLTYYSSFNSFLLNCIDVGVDAPLSKCYNWQFVVDGEYPQVGMNAYTVSDGSDVYIYFGLPKRVTVETSPIISNGIFYTKAESYSYTDDTWDPISNTIVGLFYNDPSDPWTNIEVSTSTTNSDGRAILKAESSGDFSLGIQSDYYYPSTAVSVEDAGDRITTLLRVRNGDDVVFDNILVLPTGTNIIITDSSNVDTEVGQDTVLGLLDTASKTDDSFSISNLVYYSSFDSFLINCVNVSGDDLCYNWQYAVNDDYVNVGTNAYTLQNNDKVYFYFGSSRRVTLPTSATVNESFDVYTEKYDYKNNAWLPLTGVTLGETIPDPNNPYSPTELATSTVDSLGKATFNIGTIGSYNFGIAEDYYYPTYPIEIVAKTTSESNGGGGSTNNTPDKDKMMDFLDSNQKSNGSFGADLYTDWAAIAYGSVSGHSDAKSKLKAYLKTDSLDGTTAPDYERRAMALMSLGVNPYTGGEVNYISKIIEKFDGTQFGESDLFNDDVFAIIALRSAGYSSTDVEITKARDAVVANLQSQSFGSADLAAATIQALNLVDKTSASEAVIVSAKNYILGTKDVSGGFGNISSTGWVMQALPLVSLSVDSTLLQYVYSLQQADGGVEDKSTGDNIDSRIWATEYAVVGIQGKTWNSIMGSFTKGNVTVEESQSNGSGAGGDDLVVDTEATSTPEVVTIAPITVENVAPVVVPNVILKVDTIQPGIDNTEDTKATTTEDVISEDVNLSNLATPAGTGVFQGLLDKGFAFISGIFMMIGQWIASLWS